jgi:hypothetical protein
MFQCDQFAKQSFDLSPERCACCPVTAEGRVLTRHLNRSLNFSLKSLSLKNAPRLDRHCKSTRAVSFIHHLSAQSSKICALFVFWCRAVFWTAPKPQNRVLSELFNILQFGLKSARCLCVSLKIARCSLYQLSSDSRLNNCLLYSAQASKAGAL